MRAGAVTFGGIPAAAADYQSFTALFRYLGVDDPVPSAETWLREMAPTTLLLGVGGAVVGYAYFNLMSDMAYVRHVALAPSVRGRRLGTRLMRELARRLREAGAREWCLNVKADNNPAIRLYQSVGFSRDHSSRALRLSWDAVARLPAGEVVTAAELEPTDDSAVESEFRLGDGFIADLRKRTKRVLLCLKSEGRSRGFAAFDPDFPGAFPFRVHAGLARPLLEAMRSFARAAQTEVQLVAEDDPSLVQALVGVGAVVKMEFDHYQGSIPEDRSAQGTAAP